VRLWIKGVDKVGLDSDAVDKVGLDSEAVDKGCG